MTMETIILRREPFNGWMATFSDPSVREAFGTDTVPTAFTAQASAERVAAAIQRLNLQVRVVIA